MSAIHFTPTELAEMHCVQNCEIKKDPKAAIANTNPSQKIINECQEQCKNVSSSPTSSSLNDCIIPFSKQCGCHDFCINDKAAGLEILSGLPSGCGSKCGDVEKNYCNTNHHCGVTPAHVTTQGVTHAVVSAPVVTNKKDDIPMIVAGVVVGTLVLVTIILLIVRRK